MTKSTSDDPDLRDTVSLNVSRMDASSAKDARAQRSAAALREALLSLLQRKPFEQVSVREICAEAQVHYATFFRHYAAKEALLEHVAAAQIERLVALTLPIYAAEDKPASFLQLCTYVDEHRALWSILLNGGARQTMRDEWLRLARVVADNQTSAPGWIPQELAIICSVSLLADSVSWWLMQDPGAVSAEKMAQVLQRLIAFAISDTP